MALCHHTPSFVRGCFSSLFEYCLECLVRLLFWEQLVHAQNEAARTGVVKVEVFVFVARDVSVFGNHFGRICLQVADDAVAPVGKIGVEHGLEFYAAGVVPAWLLGEVEHVGQGSALHF